MFRPLHRWLVPSILIAIVAVGCTDGKKADPAHPVALIGLDGLEWSVARPLLKEGRMPNLRGLIERGVSGYLVPDGEYLSPVIWTSIATGKKKKYHGITNFLNADRVPYTSESRRGKALWNIASDYQLDVLCVGWWLTWPAEEINGRMVAPYSSLAQNDFNWKGNLRQELEHQTWPAELLAEVWPIAAANSNEARMKELIAAYFPSLSGEEIPKLEDRLVKQTMWSAQADENFTAITEHLLRSGGAPDLTMAYLGGTDVASHRFWRFMQPDRFKYEVDAELRDLFSGTIARFYERADAQLGRLLAVLPDDANVIVCSDHGFHADFTKALPPTGLSGHHMDGPAGVIVLAGPDIRQQGADRILGDGPDSRIPKLGRIYDVAPVVLNLLGIETGRDMEQANGGPLRNAAIKPEVRQARPIVTVPTHDQGFREPRVPSSVSDSATESFIESLGQLGYLGGGSGGDR